MKIDVKTNFPDVAKQIESFGRQAEFAAAVSLTKTAKEAQNSLKSEMNKVFDRPTNYTLNSIFVKSATKANLESVVWLKDDAGKGTPADRYLKPQIFGVTRTMKGFEKALQSAGLMGKGMFAVPAAGAKLDANGNVSKSQIVQILSQLKVQRGGGYDSKRSSSAASKRTVRKQGVTYFAIAQETRGLKPGIYFKKSFVGGTAIRPVFIFSSVAKYQKRFKFFEVVKGVADKRLPVIFQEELDRAIATAMPRGQTKLF